MDSIWIKGGKRLEGDIQISGAKNSALTLLPCALLTAEPLTLGNLPRLADVDSFGHLLNELGVTTKVAGARRGQASQKMTLTADDIVSTVAPYDMVRKMRASILVLGPMLGRMGEATVSLPGGCAIGDRPIDLHLRALEAMGADIEIAAGYVKAVAPRGRISGGDFSFPVVSVGATENALMAAVLASGRTQLFNAAREPEIVDLCNLLVAMGGTIEGIGSSHLIIDGVEGLNGTSYDVMPDRIEAGSYACAAGITGGSLNLLGARADDMRAIVNALGHTGLMIEFHSDGMRVSATEPLRPLALSTAPFPGFPTDMQAQFMAMLALAEGDSFLEETIFENRYMHVPELRRMGAEVDIHGRSAIVHGVTGLTGAQVMATDLR
ncbi:MAG: UDP-N-acetylglucosamine 1-carboxyvinyltransferase, partial [Sphingomicrobium sp.]